MACLVDSDGWIEVQVSVDGNEQYDSIALMRYSRLAFDVDLQKALN